MSLLRVSLLTTAALLIILFLAISSTEGGVVSKDNKEQQQSVSSSVSSSISKSNKAGNDNKKSRSGKVIYTPSYAKVAVSKVDRTPVKSPKVLKDGGPVLFKTTTNTPLNMTTEMVTENEKVTTVTENTPVLIESSDSSALPQ